ncbi:MAG: PhoH family protein [Gammaproteobacteria bacterium]|nr:PhoH family protein [Gammaproteobacteria bacterium]
MKKTQSSFSSNRPVSSAFQSSKKKLFVLDTNVLMHDPSALFKFQEHDIYLPMSVIEELDNGKSGLTETARNTRQITRYLDELINTATQEDINNGLPILPFNHFTNSQANSSLNSSLNSSSRSSGRLFLQTKDLVTTLPIHLPGKKVDNSILMAAHALKIAQQDRPVVLVSKDINLRIKAALLGITAEDYYNDRVLDDLDMLYNGIYEFDNEFWNTHGKEMTSWNEKGRTFYQLTGPAVKSWFPNQCLINRDDPSFQAIVRKIDSDQAIIEHLKDYTTPHNTVWGIRAKNMEQNFALNLLLNPDIDFVTLHGIAGTGKTLLTLAAALAQTMENRTYSEIIMTRATVPVGDDIGFLPGTEEEKMTPWMGALMDNLEVLHQSEHNSDWDRHATQDLLCNKIKIRSLNFMRGRTFLNKFLIIDEAQNLSAKQMQTLITRAGPNTKIVCLGNLAQIDTPYLTETSCGLTYVVDNFKNWEHSGHITLTKGERSRLADFASIVF